MRRDKDATEWLRQHGGKLPRMSAGKRGMRYMGSTNDLSSAMEANPRTGSDIYVTDEFELTRVESKQSKVPGAPTMPIWQWYRCHADGRTGLR